jgi:hypothetical protein
MASLNTIQPGDIVEVELRDRKAFCHVEGKGNGELQIRAITPGFTWRTCTARQVISHYRRTKNGRKVAQG